MDNIVSWTDITSDAGRFFMYYYLYTSLLYSTPLDIYCFQHNNVIKRIRY